MANKLVQQTSLLVPNAVNRESFETSQNNEKPLTLMQLAQIGELDQESDNFVEQNSVEKQSFCYNEDKMCSGGSEIFKDAAKINISEVKPLSRLFSQNKVNQPFLLPKISDLIVQNNNSLTKNQQNYVDSKQAEKDVIKEIDTATFKFGLKREFKQIQKVESISDYLEQDNTKSVENGLKRRGRKRERDDLYFIKAQDRIKELKEQLKTAKEDGLTVKERQRLRNQVSAQQSRIRRKGESLYLNQIVKQKDEKFCEVIKYISKVMTQSQQQKMHQHFSRLWKFKKKEEQNCVVMTEKDLIALAQENQNPGTLTRAASKSINTLIHSIQELPEDTRSKFEEGLISNFCTTQEELALFVQNDQKQYE